MDEVAPAGSTPTVLGGIKTVVTTVTPSCDFAVSETKRKKKELEWRGGGRVCVCVRLVMAGETDTREREGEERGQGKRFVWPHPLMSAVLQKRREKKCAHGRGSVSSSLSLTHTDAHTSSSHVPLHMRILPNPSTHTHTHLHCRHCGALRRFAAVRFHGRLLCSTHNNNDETKKSKMKTTVTWRRGKKGGNVTRTKKGRQEGQEGTYSTS